MKRLFQADFVRAISTLSIVFFHFIAGMEENSPGSGGIFVRVPNFTLGSLFVTVFFILSGAMLYYTCQEKKYSFTSFYLHRFLSIFPSFYLVYLPLHLKASLEHGSFFYKDGSPAVFLLSLAGMDGYFNYCFPTYYYVGEWFLGALILLYLIYPLLYKCLYQCPKLAAIAILAGYGSIFLADFYRIDAFKNLFSCLLSFWLGMLLMKYRKVVLDNKMCGWTAAIFFIPLLLIKLPVSANIIVHAAGLFCFCSLYTIGSILPQNGFIQKAVMLVSTLSYPIYLIHHVIISSVLKRFCQSQLAGYNTILLFLLILMLTFVLAWLLQKITSLLSKHISSSIHTSGTVKNSPAK